MKQSKFRSRREKTIKPKSCHYKHLQEIKASNWYPTYLYLKYIYIWKNINSVRISIGIAKFFISIISILAIAFTIFQINYDLISKEEEREQREIDRVQFAWSQLLTRAGGDTGKGDMLNYLLDKRKILDGLDLSCRAIGIWENGECISRPVFSGLRLGNDRVIQNTDFSYTEIRFLTANNGGFFYNRLNGVLGAGWIVRNQKLLTLFGSFGCTECYFQDVNFKPDFRAKPLAVFSSCIDCAFWNSTIHVNELFGSNEGGITYVIDVTGSEVYVNSRREEERNTQRSKGKKVDSIVLYSDFTPGENENAPKLHFWNNVNNNKKIEYERLTSVIRCSSDLTIFEDFDSEIENPITAKFESSEYIINITLENEVELLKNMNKYDFICGASETALNRYYGKDYSQEIVNKVLSMRRKQASFHRRLNEVDREYISFRSQRNYPLRDHLLGINRSHDR